MNSLLQAFFDINQHFAGSIQLLKVVFTDLGSVGAFAKDFLLEQRLTRSKFLTQRLFNALTLD